MLIKTAIQMTSRLFQNVFADANDLYLNLISRRQSCFVGFSLMSTTKIQRNTHMLLHTSVKSRHRIHILFSFL